MGTHYVGIDLGTTNSVAAVFDGKSVEFARNPQGAALTPSVVRIDRHGAVMVGSRARKYLDTDPENTRSEFKRLMGTSTRFAFPAANVEKSPEALAAEVLRALRTDVQDMAGAAPTQAVITVPALFELPQAAATSEAARLAGFTKVELLQEPVASALAAGWRADADGAGSWLVYDLGGGTFDASLLETREGLLRVVGHDGDNFLGGRDFDQAILAWSLEQAGAAHKVTIDRADPAHAVGLRRLKLAIEDARIDLTRARATEISLPRAFQVGAVEVDIELELTRAVLDRLLVPLIDRSIAVCQRLLAAHGVAPGQCDRVVLVGGPTVTPALRDRLREKLGIPLAEGHDAMTLVAHGAALYAATAGLQAAPPAPAPRPAGRSLWLQVPTMTSDLFPFVAGRLVEGGSGPVPVEINFSRPGWESGWIPLGKDGGLVAGLDLVPREASVFRVQGRTATGEVIEVSPASITVLHGTTISDPPLSRTIGVATASADVRVYVERGAPLPARRTHRHTTDAPLVRGQAGVALRIPVVQGEFTRAHLCRVVGALEIRSVDLPATLPAQSEIEVTIEVDRGGSLQARAYIPLFDKVFQDFARLGVPEAAPDQIQEQLGLMLRRARDLALRAQRFNLDTVIAQIYDAELSLADVGLDLQAWRGGDADAGQKARRTLLDIEARLDQAEGALQHPEVYEEVQVTITSTLYWTERFGTEVERQQVTERIGAVRAAWEKRNLVEVERRLASLRMIRDTAVNRDPQAWYREFDWVASRAHEAADVPLANKLLAEGNEHRRARRTEDLRRVTIALRDLLPADADEQRKNHGSGVR